MATPRRPGPPAEYKRYDTPETAKSPPGYGVTIPPGELFYYDGVPADHLADIVAIAVGKSSHRFMVDDIAGALGCEHFSYQPEGVDHNDNVRIGGSILLSCRDMARLGQLYLNKGCVGRPAVHRRRLHPRRHHAFALNPAYGYLWWLNGTGRTPTRAALDVLRRRRARSVLLRLARAQHGHRHHGLRQAQLSTNDAWNALAPALPAI